MRLLVELWKSEGDVRMLNKCENESLSFMVQLDYVLNELLCNEIKKPTASSLRWWVSAYTAAIDVTCTPCSSAFVSTMS